MKILKYALPAIALMGITMNAAGQKRDAMPHLLVYKTKKDYSKYVAVELSADKKRVVSYPAPADVTAATGMKPISLHKGYLLSMAGISANTAYLTMTIDQYSKLQQAPAAEKLYKMAKYKTVVTELCDCGRKNTLTEEELNAIIDNSELHVKCRKIK